MYNNLAHTQLAIHTLAVRLPLSIFSKPRASTQLAMFPSTSCLASIRAVDPVEHALLTYSVKVLCVRTHYNKIHMHYASVHYKQAQHYTIIGIVLALTGMCRSQAFYVHTGSTTQYTQAQI